LSPCPFLIVIDRNAGTITWQEFEILRDNLVCTSCQEKNKWTPVSGNNYFSISINKHEIKIEIPDGTNPTIRLTKEQLSNLELGSFWCFPGDASVGTFVMVTHSGENQVTVTYCAADGTPLSSQTMQF